MARTPGSESAPERASSSSTARWSTGPGLAPAIAVELKLLLGRDGFAPCRGGGQLKCRRDAEPPRAPRRPAARRLRGRPAPRAAATAADRRNGFRRRSARRRGRAERYCGRAAAPPTRRWRRCWRSPWSSRNVGDRRRQLPGASRPASGEIATYDGRERRRPRLRPLFPRPGRQAAPHDEAIPGGLSVGVPGNMRQLAGP